MSPQRAQSSPRKKWVFSVCSVTSVVKVLLILGGLSRRQRRSYSETLAAVSAPRYTACTFMNDRQR
jgi:hypothetical protein